MILSIIEHDDGVLSPMLVFTIKIVAELGKKEAEGRTVGLASVDSIEHLVPIGHSTDDVNSRESRRSGHLVLYTLDHPSSLTRVSTPNDTFIDVDDAPTFAHCSNILSCCYLPLPLCWREVLVSSDLLD